MNFYPPHYYSFVLRLLLSRFLMIFGRVFFKIKILTGSNDGSPQQQKHILPAPPLPVFFVFLLSNFRVLFYYYHHHHSFVRSLKKFFFRKNCLFTCVIIFHNSVLLIFFSVFFCCQIPNFSVPSLSNKKRKLDED